MYIVKISDFTAQQDQDSGVHTPLRLIRYRAKHQPTIGRRAARHHLRV